MAIEDGITAGVYKNAEEQTLEVLGVAQERSNHRKVVVYRPSYGPHAGALLIDDVGWFLSELRKGGFKLQGESEDKSLAGGFKPGRNVDKKA